MLDRKKKINLIVIISGLVLLGLIFYFNSNGSSGETDDVEQLAKCLSDSGAKLYGAYWCPHCQEQKDLFGDAVEYLPYVECTEEAEACAEAGIQGYPSWILADGTVLLGGQSLDTLAQATGC